jgi:hypothetical protein
MRSDRVLEVPSAFGQGLRFTQDVEDRAVAPLIPEAGVEAVAIAVFPGMILPQSPLFPSQSLPSPCALLLKPFAFSWAIKPLRGCLPQAKTGTPENNLPYF